MSNDPVARSDELDARLADAPVIQTLLRLGKSNQSLVRIALGSVAFDIVLSVVIGLLAIQANDVAGTATAAVAQGRVNCLASNEARSTDRHLWNYILSFPPPSDETAAARAERIQNVAKFRAYLDAKLGPRDCSSAALSRVKPGTLPPPISPAPTTPGSASALGPVPTPGAPVAPARSHAPARHENPPATRTTAAGGPPTRSPSSTPAASPSPSRSPLLCVLGHCVVHRHTQGGVPSPPVRGIAVLVNLNMAVVWLRWRRRA